MPFDVKTFSAIVGGLKSYEDAMAQGREDMATQAYQEVMGGINALKGITGIRGDVQRMRIEGAEERRRAALHPGILATKEAEEAQRVAMRPVELRTAEAGAERAEVTAETMQMELDQQRKTIEALEARLREVEGPPTMEAMEKWEGIDEWVAARKEKRAEARVGAEVTGLRAEEVAAEVERRMREEELARGIPERRVEVAEEMLAVEEKKAGYEKMVIDSKVAEGVPEIEAKQIGLMASRELDQADAAIKLARRNARLAKTRAEALEAEMAAAELQREAMAKAGLEMRDFMFTQAKIEAGLLPKANEVWDNMRDAMRILTTLKTRPAGEIDPLNLMMAEAMSPSMQALVQQMLPDPKEREEAMDVMSKYVNSQIATLNELGVDYYGLAESAIMYDKSDLETGRSDEKIEYTEGMFSVEGVETHLSAAEMTDKLDKFALNMLNNADLLRDDVLYAISSNMTEGQNLYRTFGQANIDKLYRLLDALQKDKRVTAP